MWCEKDEQKADELFNSVRDRVYVDYNISDVCNCIALGEKKVKVWFSIRFKLKRCFG